MSAVNTGPTHRQPCPHLDELKGKPINVRLLEAKNQIVKITPRSYQDELFKIALDENVIIFLGTGLGKTFITVLYINSPQVDELLQSGKKVVFLATTQDLIKQQAEYINKQVPYRVKIFCGRTANCGLHIDHWEAKTWDRELDKVDLLFMTPSIFASAVSTALLDFSRFAAIIFDEFHHSCRSKSKTGGHPYRNILLHYNEYYRNKPSHPRPRLIGLTASLINSMPKNRESIRDEVAHLETLIRGRCVTNIEVNESKPTMITHSYVAFKYTPENDLLTNILTDLKKRLDEVLKNKPKTRNPSELAKIQTYQERLLLAARGLSIKPGSFPKVIEGLILIRQRCGIWALNAVCNKLVEALERPSARNCMSSDTKNIYNAYTETIRALGHGLKQVLQSLNLDEALLSYSCAKPICLLDILKREYKNTLTGSNNKDSFSCIIFVRSRLEVTAICQWLQNISCILPEYSFIKCDYAIGLAATMASKYACITKRKPSEQSKMLEDFRNGTKNVIVTTAVLEEGIDLPVCSTVIRYDQPNNFREYVQSRGRARQQVSSFVLMCEEAKRLEDEQKLNKLNDFEITLKKVLSNHDVRGEVSRKIFDTSRDQGDYSSVHKVDIYTARDNAIRITPPVARTILHMYCQLLSRHTPFTEGIRYDRIEPSSGLFRTSIFMPTGCPVENAVVGGVKSSKDNADNSAIVAAVKALIEAGELNENGTPFRVNEENLDELLKQHEMDPTHEPLVDNGQFGISELSGERVYFRHKPKMRTLDQYLSKDHRTKSYRLVPIRFVGADSNVRDETRGLMEAQVFGLIFDSNLDTSFIPEFLFTHYGKFEVFFQTPSEQFEISNLADHNVYSSYTHKLMTRCLGISRLRLEEFRYHCQCYVVPLTGGVPDKRRMEDSFTSRSYKLRPGDVVKFRRYFTGDNRRNREPNKVMIVRAIRSDLNARSFVPGKRDRVTFLQDAEYQYGRGVVTRLDQPIVEVMPLSSEFARTDTGKRRGADSRTPTLFYLEQFLEFFDEDSAAVIQSFNLPAIIYRLYQEMAAGELDQKFVSATEEHRPKASEAHEETHVLRIADIQPALEEREDRDHEDSLPHSELLPSTDEQMETESIEGSCDDNEGSDEDCDDHTVYDDGTQEDTDYENDVELLTDREKMILAKRFDLNEDDDTSLMQKWDFSEYQVKNLEVLSFVRRSAPLIDLDLDRDARMGSIFAEMKARLGPLMHDLVDQLERYEHKLLQGDGLLDLESEFDSKIVSVDRTIEPPFSFARASQPFRVSSSRATGLIEALTLKSAHQETDLEALENIGDSYLKYLVSVIIHQELDGNEGILTSVRSRLTSNKNFTYLARRMQLGTYAIDRPFTKDRLAHWLGQELSPDEEKASMNRLRSKDLADMFESIVGSYLVYQGQFEAVLALKWLGLHVLNDNTFAELSPRRVAFPQAPSAFADEANDREYQSCRKRLSRVEKILNYQFKDPSYLVQAFTHASCIKKCTRSYERLEFLGDAILDFLTTMTLDHSGLVKSPGQMTASRSALVNNSAFARLALKYGFDMFLLFFNHEIYLELERVRQTLDDDPNLDCFDLVEFDSIVKLLGDLFESVAGAIYLDSGCSLDTVWSVYYPMLKENIEKELRCPSKNAVSTLYETFPGTGRISFETYDTKTDQGDMVGVRCSILGFGVFDGRGLSRRQAKKRAIEAAMAKPLSAEDKKRLDQDYLASHPRPTRDTNQRSRGRGRAGRGPGSRGRGQWRR